ncbi:family 43 glycosylhydrolase [candidate division KSB1 bacterium]|nr:family 43 glycosylhydrolase [candidate division KSB1 bacterium]
METTFFIPPKWFRNQQPSKFSLRCIMVLVFLSANCYAQNPVIRHMFTADPSAHVWNDGRLYVYPSHDIAPPRGCDLMDRYHVFSTENMIEWTDHGEILNSGQVSWGRPEGGFMWAPDCAFKNGTYYFYFPHPSETEWNRSWKTGVATSSKPASDFTVQGYIPGLESFIDPCVFTDDDGQAYFYYGGGGVCKGGRLKDNMMEIDGEMQEMKGLIDFHEAAWVHKRNNIYYLSYSDNHDVGNSHNRMRYATSDFPLGPWKHRGIYMDPTDSYTNHGSIIEYKGQWYAFYHNSALSNHDWLRSICVDSLFYDDGGSIQKVIQTRGHGTPYGGRPREIPGTIEAEDYDSGGQAFAYSDSDTTNNGGAYRLGEGVDIETCSAGGFNVGWTNAGEWLEYTIHVKNTGDYDVIVHVASPEGGSIHLSLDGEDITGSMTIPATGGWQNWQTISKTKVPFKAGKHILQLYEETGGFNIDKIVTQHVSHVPDKSKKDNNQYGFQVYPNPAVFSFKVKYQTNLLTPVKFEIYDLLGRLVHSVNETSTAGINQTEINIGNLTSGHYFIKLTSDSMIKTERVMVVK